MGVQVINICRYTYLHIDIHIHIYLHVDIHINICRWKMLAWLASSVDLMLIYLFTLSHHLTCLLRLVVTFSINLKDNTQSCECILEFLLWWT